MSSLAFESYYCLKKNAPSYGQTHQGKLHCGGGLENHPSLRSPQKCTFLLGGIWRYLQFLTNLSYP